MYTKDKNQRITLRLNEKQFAFVKLNAEQLDVSPSDFLRMVVNLSMVSYEKANEQIAEKVKSVAEASKEVLGNEKEGDGRENDKTDKHDFV